MIPLRGKVAVDRVAERQSGAWASRPGTAAFGSSGDWFVWPLVGRDIVQTGPSQITAVRRACVASTGRARRSPTARGRCGSCTSSSKGRVDVVGEDDGAVLETIGPGDHVGRKWLERRRGEAGAREVAGADRRAPGRPGETNCRTCCCRPSGSWRGRSCRRPSTSTPCAGRRGSSGVEFEGRTILITGASSGIGAATARAVARAGGHAVVVARTRPKLERGSLPRSRRRAGARPRTSSTARIAGPWREWPSGSSRTSGRRTCS